jgi:hypothetical protein
LSFNILSFNILSFDILSFNILLFNILHVYFYVALATWMDIFEPK